MKFDGIEPILQIFLLFIPAFILFAPFYVFVFTFAASNGSGVPSNRDAVWRVHVNCGSQPPKSYWNHTVGLYQLDTFYLYPESPQRFGFCRHGSARQGNQGDKNLFTNRDCIYIAGAYHSSAETWAIMDLQNAALGYNTTLKDDVDIWKKYIYGHNGYKASYAGAFTSYLIIYWIVTYTCGLAAFPYSIIPCVCVNWLLTLICLPIYYTWLPILSETSQMDPLAWSTWYFQGCDVHTTGPMIDGMMNQGTAGWLIFFVYVVFAPVTYLLVTPVIYFFCELSEGHYFHHNWTHGHLDEIDVENASHGESRNAQKSLVHLSGKLARVPNVVAKLSWKQGVKNLNLVRQMSFGSQDEEIKPSNKYEWLESRQLLEAGNGVLFFDACAAYDLSVGFSSKIMTQDPMYEITLGTEQNNLSLIRKRNQGTEFLVEKSGSHCSKSGESYWIKLDKTNKHISCGKGKDIGTNIIVECTDPNFLDDVLYFAFSSLDINARCSKINISEGVVLEMSRL